MSISLDKATLEAALLGYQQHLRLLAGELGVADRVRFLGFRSDGPDLMQAADFVLLPSTREGLPLSILEAQASKVPVLAAPTAGVPEVVTEGETGFLIPATDAVVYADRIQRLLGNADLRHRVTEQAYTKVKREHSWQVYCERISELYRQLTDPQAERRKSPAPTKPKSCESMAPPSRG